MQNFFTIIAVGIVAILMIIVASIIGLPHHVVMGIILTAISVLLFLVAGAVWNSAWPVGLTVGCIAVAVFLYAVHEFSIVEPAKQALLLPPVSQLLSHLY
jgi:hypothetical protein